MKITYRLEAHTPAGQPVFRFSATNATGVRMEFTDLGARWIAAVVPDANGIQANVLRGYDDISDYVNDAYYMGATIGRFANRIAKASFTIGENRYRLEANDGKNTNHGGSAGFHGKVWEWELLPDGVRFSLESPDGEGGYPGNIRAVAEYRLSETDELSVCHYAETDRPTYINLTNHAYFNLSGTSKKITEHFLHIPSDDLLDTTSEFIPTGKIVKVSGTPFDFTSPKPIGSDLYADHEQLRWNRGYNHYYILKDTVTSEMLQAASLYDPGTGRRLTVTTDLPGVLLYTAGYYEQPDTAVCLETQFYPDTPSHPSFPSCLLRPGEIYAHRTRFKFEKQTKEIPNK